MMGTLVAPVDLSKNDRLLLGNLDACESTIVSR
jgi:hypothetical protein